LWTACFSRTPPQASLSPVLPVGARYHVRWRWSGFPGRRPHNIPPPLPRALVAGSWLARGRSDDDASRRTEDGGRQRARMVGAAFSGDRACLACVWWAGPARPDALALRLCTSSQSVGETASHSPWRTMGDVMRSAIPARSSRQSSSRSSSRSCPSDQAPASSSSSSMPTYTDSSPPLVPMRNDQPGNAAGSAWPSPARLAVRGSRRRREVVPRPPRLLPALLARALALGAGKFALVDAHADETL
jgi:hypothetical protein